MSVEGSALPDGWTLAPLAEIGLWSGGGTPSKRNPAYWEGGDIPWVSPKDMGPPQLSRTQDKITRLASEETAARTLPAGSIAFVVRSGVLNRTLPISLVPFEAAYNQDMRVLTPAAGLDVHWLLWALRGASEDIRRVCRKDGVTVASIEVPRLLQYRLAIPPWRQQDAHRGDAESEIRCPPARDDRSYESSRTAEALSGVRSSCCGHRQIGRSHPAPSLRREVDSRAHPCRSEGAMGRNSNGSLHGARSTHTGDWYRASGGLVLGHCG